VHVLSFVCCFIFSDCYIIVNTGGVVWVYGYNRPEAKCNPCCYTHCCSGCGSRIHSPSLSGKYSFYTLLQNYWV